MTPKEKAEELINHFNPYVGYKYNAAKQCALIAVEELLDTPVTWMDISISEEDGDTVDYWCEVKTEIENL